MFQRLKVVKVFLAVCLVWVSIVVYGRMALAATIGRIKPLTSQATFLKNDKFEMEIPAGAVEQELTVDEVDVDLEGIAKPRSFKAVSKMFRFGPSGTTFAQGKEIFFRLNLDSKNQNAKLYYVNRTKKCLEPVESQQFNRETGRLEAKLRHFSDYVPGISAGWDGNGISFFDIVNGEESFNPASNKLSVRSTVLSIPVRGSLVFNLTRTFTPSEPIEALRITGGWQWDIPFIGKVIKDSHYFPCNIPGVGTFDVRRLYEREQGDQFGNNYNMNGVYFTIRQTSPSAYSDLTPEPYLIVLSDGTSIEKTPNVCVSYKVKVSDIQGNWYEYTIEDYSLEDDGRVLQRISSVKDCLGRNFKFIYDRSNRLTQITQQLKNGQVKTILSVNSFLHGESFTDALGRTTSYSSYSDYFSVLYPNGTKSEWSWDYRTMTSINKLYKPNQSQPFRVVQYSTIFVPKNSDGSYRIVNDGTKIKKYHVYTKWAYGVGGYNPWITNESTYSLSEQLLESKDYTYYEHDYDNDMMKTISSTRTTVSGALGTKSTYQYEYDDWGNITRVINPEGTETRMAYVSNSEKRLALFNSQYQDSKYSYASLRPSNDSPVTKATLVKDPVSLTTQLKQIHYQYNGKNKVQESEVYGGSFLNTSYTYDSYGNVLTKTDASGNKLGFEYSDVYKNAYLTRVYKPETNQTIATYEYDFDTGNKTMATDAKGNVYRYEYDAVGRLVREYLENSNSKIAITRIISYDDTNNVVTLKFGNASTGYQVGRLEYDPLFGKPTKIQRYKGLVAADAIIDASDVKWITQKQYEYDTNGRLAWEQDGNGHRTSYTYDELDRKTSVTQPNGSVTKYAYDDRTMIITDANGNKKEQTFDLLDRLVSVKESPDKGTTFYTTTYDYDSFYDNSGDKPVYHLVRVTNPKNAATINTYDNLGRLIRTDYPQDGSNPMAAETFTYDNVGNLLTKTSGKGTKSLDYEFFAGYRLKKVTEPGGKVIDYTYDANDNPLSQSTSGATYTYTYDERNRVTSLNAQLDGYSFNVGYDYDTYGRVTGITYPGRTSPVNYSYDDLDLLQTIPGFVNSCTYDADNKLTAMALANGISNTYEYDVNDRPTKINAGSLLNLSYSYDPVGNITQINTDYYDYDGLNRLKWYGNQPYTQKATANGTEWAYDGAGNMTSKATILNGASSNVSFTYDLANRLWSMGTTTYTNDNAGARIGKNKGEESWSYIYDGESRLTQANKNGVTQVLCAYDGSGIRYKKVENGKTIYYIFSGSNPLVEYTPADSNYKYRIYAGKRAVAEEKAGVVKFFHKDHLSSTRVVTDFTGAKIAEYKYAPYGEKEISTGDGSDYQFTDKANDESTGLSYFGARFYDQETGRFLTVDPKKDGANWFIYCRDNPINCIDPDGRKVYGLSYGKSTYIVLGYEYSVAAVKDDKGNYGIAITVGGGVGVEPGVSDTSGKGSKSSGNSGAKGNDLGFSIGPVSAFYSSKDTIYDLRGPGLSLSASFFVNAQFDEKGHVTGWSVGNVGGHVGATWTVVLPVSDWRNSLEKAFGGNVSKETAKNIEEAIQEIEESVSDTDTDTDSDSSDED